MEAGTASPPYPARRARERAPHPARRARERAPPCVVKPALQILYWLKSGVTVCPRFGFQATTADTVRKRFGLNFVASLSEAMGHRG
jgi:hypothetical protein